MADIAKWRDAVKSEVIESWITQAESKGIPGKKIYEDILKMIEAARK